MTHPRSLPLSVSLVLALAAGCQVAPPPDSARLVTAFSEDVTNLAAVNSEFDDYNPIPPPGPGLLEGLYFSSNRSTAGGTFDFEYVSLQVDARPGEALSFQAHRRGNEYPEQLLRRVNTPVDEFGPNFVAASVETVPGVLSGDVAFLFARDDAEAGGLNVYLLRDPANGALADAPIAAAGINSPANDAYPCVTDDQSAVYFTSDRDGSYDLFVAESSASTPARGVDRAVHLLTGDQTRIRTLAALNSDADDKCPFVSGDRLIFTSDRAGGYGGFDLWISRLDATGWSAPVNLGPRINSAQDEYRPILLTAREFENDLLIFSSNRPGGLGGFDLHYVGFPRGDRGVDRPWVEPLVPVR